AVSEERAPAAPPPLELLAPPVRPRAERRGTADLDALPDLDLLAEADAPVAGGVCGAPGARRPPRQSGRRRAAAAEPRGGSSGPPPPGANMRPRHCVPSPAKQ